jgi:hypothetical protein
VGGDLIGSDDVEDVVCFDEESGRTDAGWGYNALGNEGAQIHIEKRIRKKARENENRA